MRILKALSALLCYPTPELIEALPELAALISAERRLDPLRRAALGKLLEELRQSRLIVAQQRYIEWFDRGRSLSLHLFEHVHAESRDRGQAMVDLVQLYESHGYELAARELPDYLPLLLEFLALIPAEAALQQLRDAAPILNLLGARLAERENSYRAVFDALADLVGQPPEQAAIQAAVAAEGPDETLARMDEIWEEEAVSFMARPDGCGAATAGPQPIRITPRPAAFA
jgi:nitrate reductase molybdenum cofactor assembly chaperone NarJ/NarW